MTSSTDQVATSLESFAQAYQDQRVVARIPDWLRAIDRARLDELTEALARSLEHRQRVSALLSRVKNIRVFTQQALEAAMNQRFKTTFHAARWTLRAGRREMVINQQPVGAHLTKLKYQQIPLLEAMLCNFTAQEASPGGQPTGNRLVCLDGDEKAPMSAVEFAALCRDLDAGKQYQRHLQAVFAPQKNGDDPQSLMADAKRYAMWVEAYKAHAEGVLTKQELQWVVGLCRDNALRRFHGAPVVVGQLRLLGCDLSEIVVFDIIDEGLIFNSSKRVLVYIPGDPHGPWSAFANLQRFARTVLGKRLRKPAYQQFFSRFVRRRDSQRFFSTIIAGYHDLADWANIDLDEYMRAFKGSPFDSLAVLGINQIKDDAAMIATPVAALDREVQREHQQRLAAQGWTLLSLAGLFVPALGASLLAVTVWMLLDEAFLGIEAWQDRDTQAALAHLMNVAKDLAVIGIATTAIVGGQRLWQRAVGVDSLVSTRLEDGTVKLWDQDLTRYRCLAPPRTVQPDQAGIYRQQGRAWIQMDGHYYQIRQRSAGRQWQLLPVTAQTEGAPLHPNDHAPLLRHNGAGGWRLASEQPGAWKGTHYLFRRFGGPLAELDDKQIDQVLAFHGLEEKELRALHVYNRAPDAVLLDSVERTVLAQRLRDLVSRLRSGLGVDDQYALQQARRLPGAAALTDPQLAELAWRERRALLGLLYEGVQQGQSPGCTALRRVFPSLHRRAAQALVDGASTADRQRLLESGRVGLRLAEAATAQVLHIRVARVLESFLLDTPQTRDLARVAIGLLKYLSGALFGVRWRLFEGSLGGPQLAACDQGAQVADLVHIRGSFVLCDAQGVVVGDPGELFEVMARAYEDAQRRAMGIVAPFAQNLRASLGVVALQRRDKVMGILRGPMRRGRFQLPERQADGRIGYPMSGRGIVGRLRAWGRPRALIARVHDLYPDFSMDQVNEWVDAVRQSGRSVHGELNRLDEEIADLEECLFVWSAEAASTPVREARETVSEALSNCWRRMSIVGPSPNPLSSHFRLTVQGMEVGHLPELPAQVSFSHVTELLLMDMALQEIPQGFWQAFSRLQVLDLGGNSLTRVPPQLMRLEQLRELILIDNRIVLDAPQAVTLSRCVHLVVLDLSHNPLGRTFSLARLEQLLRLDMRGTGIVQLPDALMDLPRLVYADLRDNRIRALPTEVALAPMAVRRRLRLAGNPCAEGPPLEVADAWSDDDDPDVHPQSPRQRWSDAIGAQHRGSLLICWSALEGEPGGERLFRVLRQLLRSEGFVREPRVMARRVLAVLRAMADDPALRQQLFDVANDEWGCQDGASWCFDNLEVNVLVWRAQHDTEGSPEQALIHLGRQLWRLEQVDRIAVSDVQERGLEYEGSEVGLAYRIGLRERLDLPINTDDMSYPGIAGVDDLSLDHAYTLVMARETQERLAGSLVDRPFWQAHLERTHTERMTAVDAPFQERLAGTLDDDSLSMAEQLEQSALIRVEQRAARRDLMLELTREALETAVPAPSGEEA